MSRGKKLPKAIREAPRLHFGLELYFQAYMDLQGDRGGMGDGPIPWMAVEAYCRANGFDDDLADDCHYYVREMDDAWLTWRKEKADQDKKNKL